jgi:hypothetical protein
MVAVGLAQGGKQAAHPAEPAVVCPAAISVTETVAPLPGWTLHNNQAQHAFERISVANKEGEKEYDLAPDGQEQKRGKVIQTWYLKDYRDMPIMLTCRYHDTSATLTKDLPQPLSTCTLKFEMDKGGNIVGESSMSCQ